MTEQMTGRHDDAHQKGCGVLRVYADTDDDMVVAIEFVDSFTMKATSLSVEFCTIGAGGGASPEVFQALKNLTDSQVSFAAIIEKNESKMTGRHDDAHQKGCGVLRVYADTDGDMVVAIESVDSFMMKAASLSAKFCTIGASGGASPEFFQALKNLAEAIERDNKARPSHAHCRP